MTCVKPYYLDRAREKRGNKYVINQLKARLLGDERVIKVPCGQCIACRISRTAEWTTRILDESDRRPSCFCTLTYNPENVPSDFSISKKAFQDFIKRLRGRIGVPIKYYACGEYGDKGDRPHYHFVLIGYNFIDLYFAFRKNNRNYYASPLLESLWPYGFNTVGTLDVESASYVAGYIRKKLTGKRSIEYNGRQPPFALFSLGLGRGFALSHEDLIKKGRTRFGKHIGTPKYYKKLIWTDEDEAEDRRKARQQQVELEDEAKLKGIFKDLLFAYDAQRRESELKQRQNNQHKDF